MIALLIWLTGVLLIGWQMTSHGYWHDLAAVLTGMLFILWVILGAAILSARLRATGARPKSARISPVGMQKAVDRINAERDARKGAAKGRELA